MANELTTNDGYLMRLQIEEREGRGPSGSHGEKYRRIRQQEIRRVTTLKAKAEQVRDDLHFSPAGKAAKWAELKGEQDLSPVTTAQTEIQSHVKRLHALLYAPPKSEHDPAMAFLRAQEIRSAYKDKPPHERDAAFLKAMEDGQHEIARALVGGPLGSLVSAEFQQRVEQEHAARTQPLVYENYQQFISLKEHLDSLHDHATRALNAMSADAPTMKQGGRNEERAHVPA